MISAPQARMIFIGLGRLCCCVVFLSLLTGCKVPKHPSAIDPSDISQPDEREALRKNLPDLLFAPDANPALNLRYLLRLRLYSPTLAVFAVFDSAGLSPDSSRQLLRSYVWSREAKKYLVSEEWSLGHVSSIQTRDLTNDGLDEMILSTTNADKRGLAIWGKGESDQVVSRFRSDSLRPVIIEHKNNFALLVYDSLQIAGFNNLLPAIPRRYFGLRGGAYIETPTDPDWLALYAGIRDSLQQFYALKRESILNNIPIDRSSFIRSAVALALFDSSWESTQSFLQRQIAAMRVKLPASASILFSKIAEMNRTHGYVHIGAPNTDAELILLLSRFDDAIAGNEQTEALGLMQATARRAPQLKTLLSLVRTALLEDTPILLYGAKSILDEVERSGRVSAEELRLHARVEERLYNQDAARSLFERSLLLDSTSRAADEVRMLLYRK